jgi:hypothetical protein
LNEHYEEAVRLLDIAKKTDWQATPNASSYAALCMLASIASAMIVLVKVMEDSR